MRSIRAFLLYRLLGGAALVLAAAGVAVYLLIARSLEQQFDQNLSDRIQGFASIIFQVGEQVEFEFSDELMPEYGRDRDPDYFEIRFDDGRLLERSKSLHGQDLELQSTPGDAPQHWSAPLPDGRPGRYAAELVEVHHVYPEEGPDRPVAAVVTIAVARGRGDLHTAERSALLQCVAVALILMLFIACVSWFSVKKGLEPALRLAKALDAIQVEELPESLNVGELPAELGPMAETTNALIERVDKALERERRTTADIAHELRTPISELLTVSEVALRDGRDTDGARRALGKVRDIAWHMGRSVSTLLKLARLEQGTEISERVGVDLGGIVCDALRAIASVARERALRVENRLRAGEQVEGDGEVLRIVVSNLLGNALDYSPRGGAVECRLERSGRAWRFVVENDAPDLRAEDLPNLCEPFWRKDGAREARNHSGLGLALSKVLAERISLEMSFELENGVFRALVTQRNDGSRPVAFEPAQRPTVVDVKMGVRR